VFDLCKSFPLFLLLFFDSLAATESFSNVFCGKMLDTQTGLVQSNVTINIDHGSGKIRSVRFNDVFANPNNLDTLDLSNYFCLPGLIDMHTHISEGTSRTLVEYLTVTQQDQLVIGRVNVQKTLLAGFTSVRDLGVYIAWTDKALRDEINSGLTNGPRMQISGFYLTIPGGGGDIAAPGGSSPINDNFGSTCDRKNGSLHVTYWDDYSQKKNPGFKDPYFTSDTNTLEPKLKRITHTRSGEAIKKNTKYNITLLGIEESGKQDPSLPPNYADPNRPGQTPGPKTLLGPVTFGVVGWNRLGAGV
jgi:hypothetical protein